MSAVASPGAPSLATLARRRRDGGFTIDDWGLDRELVRVASPLLGLRWAVETEWAERLPADGPALLVYNRTVGWSEPFVVARGVGMATGRFVRVAGVPDVAPVGPLLRRLGGVLDGPDEVRGLLHAGELVAVALGRDRPHRAGPAPAALIAGARAAGVPVHPVALVGREVGRSWRVVVGAAVPPSDQVGPLAEAEFVEATRLAVQATLDGPRPAVGVGRG